MTRLTLLLLSGLLVPHFLSAEPIVLSTESGGKAEAASEGFVLEQLKFNPSGGVSGAKALSGSVYESYRPGNVWHGELPGFISPEIEVGGEEVLPCTDVYESGRLIYAHYGPDHYQTKAISIIDETRKEVALISAFSVENIARAIFDPETGILYYSVVEGNLDGKDKARIHAFSTKEGVELWRSEAGTSHGNFLVEDQHIISHYGFTDEDDFLFVIDKGNGKTLKKSQLKTAADLVIKEGSKILVPCYQGSYEFSFSEN
ncbi:MAG: hypothetical protein CMO55_03820 [Verrucomicrobiales bacterium]|nr:hypothetical protein [Verrucomicrobiales bacterium]